MSKEQDTHLHLPQDLLVPKGDALLLKLKDHINKGGKVWVHIQGQEEKTITTEEELFKITEPFTNQ